MQIEEGFIHIIPLKIDVSNIFGEQQHFYSTELKPHPSISLIARIELHIIEGTAYLFNQGELGEGSVGPPGTTLNWTAVELLRALHVLSDGRIHNTILTIPAKDKRKRTKQRHISISAVHYSVAMAYRKC